MMQQVVQETLNRYRDDEIMLDALLQWASNPTSMSAGYGLEENYPYIVKNLAARYGISRLEAEKRVAELRDGALAQAWSYASQLQRQYPNRTVYACSVTHWTHLLTNDNRGTSFVVVSQIATIKTLEAASKLKKKRR